MNQPCRSQKELVMPSDVPEASGDGARLRPFALKLHAINSSTATSPQKRRP